MEYVSGITYREGWEHMERSDILRVNLLIMKNLWKAYFGYVENKQDVATNFYKFLGMESTKTSNIINGSDNMLKDGVIAKVCDTTGMKPNILKGKYLITVGGDLLKEFKKYGKDLTEESGWDIYCGDGNADFNRHIQKILYAELKKQLKKGFADEQLRLMYEYMKGVKGILRIVEEDISRVSLPILQKCTPQELEHYKAVLLEEYNLVSAIRTIQCNKKIKSMDEELEEKIDG